MSALCRRGARPVAPRTGGGFSLIEVLVAITILVLAVGGLYQSMGLGMRAAERGAGYSRATLHARSLLETAGVESPLTLGTERGELAGGYRFTQTVEPFIDPEGTEPYASLESWVPPRQVTVSVSWTDAGAERSMQLTSVRLGTP